MNLIPVHINFAHDFFTQYESSKKCKGLEYYELNKQHSQEMIHFLNGNEKKELGNFFTADEDGKYFRDYELAYKFFDTLYCLYTDAAEEFDKVVKILGGSAEEFVKNCTTFLNMNNIGYLYEDLNDDEKNFNDNLVSPLFQRILDYMESVVEKYKKGEKDYKGYDIPKYYLISGVANTCGSFMTFMKSYFNTRTNFIDFATNIHLELYLEKESGDINENDFRVEYYFNDDFLLSRPYVEFRDIVRTHLKNKTEILDFCTKEKDEVENWYIIYAFIVLGIILVLLVIIVIVIKKRKYMNKEETVTDGENQALVRDTKISTE